MKKIMKCLLLLTMLFTTIVYTKGQEINKGQNFYTELAEAKKNVEKGSKSEKFLKRSEKMWGPRLYPSGDFEVAKRGVGSYVVNFAEPTKSSQPSNWVNIDQKDKFTGQIHCIEFHPCYDGVNNQIIYAGSPYGGLFVTENNGDTWQNLNTDVGLPIASVTDIQIVEYNPNIMYIATGAGQGSINEEINQLGNVSTVLSAGIYKTTDGGVTWSPFNDGLESLIEKGLRVGKIIFNQNTFDLIASTNYGIYKYDGTSWTEVLSFANQHDWYGLEFQPGTNYNTVYCTSGNFLYKSTDEGDTWNQVQNIISNPIRSGFRWWFILKYPNYVTNDLFVRADIAFPEGEGQDANTFYIYVLAKLGVEQYTAYTLFRHDLVNGVDVWNEVKSEVEGPNASQTAYEPTRISMVVDPNDNNTVYYCHTRVTRTESDINGEVSTSSSHYSSFDGVGIHADHHALEINNNTPNVLWNGNDGGISICIKSPTDAFFDIGNGGSYLKNDPFWSTKNNGLQVQLIWRFDDSEFDENSYIAGYQDNAVHYHNVIGWNSISGGDGFEAAIDDYNGKNRLYCGTNGGGRYYIDDYPRNSHSATSTSSLETTIFNDPNDEWNGNPIGIIQSRKTDIYPHPTNGEVYISGGNSLNSTIDFTKKNGDLINVYPDGESVWAFSSDGTYVYYLDRNIGELERDFNFTITYSDGHYLKPQFSVASGGIGSNHNPVTLPTQYGSGDNEFHALSSDIAEGDASNIVPEEPNPSNSPLIHAKNITFNNSEVLFMSFSGYHDEYKVYAYSPVIKEWRNMDPNKTLPNLPVNAITYDKTSGLLFAGTDVGVYVFNSSNDNWEEYGDFPRVKVMQMKVNRTFRKLRVATYGRGLWETELPSTCVNSLVHTDPISDWTNSYTAIEIESSSSVNNNVMLTYTALDQITLKPGFMANSANNVHVLVRTSDFACASSYQSTTRPTVSITFEDCNSNGGNGGAIERSSITEIEEKEYFETTVFPNPATGIVYINTTDDDSYSAVLRDIQGKEIKSTSNFVNNYQINVSDIETGIYFLEISNSEGKRVVKKMTKK